MSKPFRFSIRQMLVATALFGLASALLTWVFSEHPDPVTDVVAVLASGTDIGAGVGLVLGRPALCAFIGFGLAVFAMVVCILASFAR